MTRQATDTLVVIDDMLPWADEFACVSASGRFDPSALHVGAQRRECVVRTISAGGALLGNCRGVDGERVALELATGQRAPGAIAWSSGRGELGVRFDSAIDMIALLNRKLVSQAPERRTMPRLQVRCPLHIKAGAQFSFVTLRNISSQGLQIEGDGLPPIGTYVCAVADGLNVPPGEVVWRNDATAGIELLEEIGWTSLTAWVRAMVRSARN